MSRFRLSLVVVVAVAVGSTLASANTGNDVVRVQKGKPVQIAVVLPTDQLSDIIPGIRKAIELAVQEHQTIRGFPIQLNFNSLRAPCFGDDVVALNAKAAQAVVDNPQNVAVIGHLCSHAFGDAVDPVNGVCTNPPFGNALSIYERFRITTINGSTTLPCLTLVGPHVFNGVSAPDTDPPANTVSLKWYLQVQALQSDKDWYLKNFGFAPKTDFADLYYDATNLLLKRLAQESEVKDGKLVIDRAELAEAVRDTKGFCGVTGKVSLDKGGYRVNAITPCP